MLTESSIIRAGAMIGFLDISPRPTGEILMVNSIFTGSLRGLPCVPGAGNHSLSTPVTAATIQAESCFLRLPLAL
jgi:hypothetical protein